jgi:hypothetical protein
MARRASSSVHPAWILLAVLVALVAIGAGYLIFGKVNDPYRTMSMLPVQDYLQNSNSLRGNVYKVEGTVDQALKWSRTSGRLFSVEVAGGDVLPILVPPEFNRVNMERGQRFFFKIEVGEEGILRAQDLRKA